MPPSPALAPVDQALLPCAFTPSQLWAVCAIQPRTGHLLEALVLADPGPAGLSALSAAFPATGGAHALSMAFSLDQLRRLREGLAANAQAAGMLDADALGVSRNWPAWFSAPVSSFLVWALVNESPTALWVRTRTRAEAALCVPAAHPGAQVLGMGVLDDLQAHINRLEAVVANQDFGALFFDLRAAVDRPATAAHIAAYPLAALGLHPTPQHAMAAHQALSLEVEANAEPDEMDHAYPL